MRGTEPSTSNPGSTDAGDEQKSENNGSLWIGIAVAAVLLAGGVVFFVLKRRKDQSK